METDERYEQAVELVEQMTSAERLRFYAWFSAQMSWNSTPKLALKEERFRYYVAVMNKIVGVDIMQRSRKREVVLGRNIVMTRLASEGVKTDWVGEKFGMKHCSVIHARQRVQDMLLMPRAYPNEMAVYKKFYEKIMKKDEKAN